MNAERLRTLTDVVTQLPHDDPYWMAAFDELVELNRAIAAMLEKGPEPVAHISLGQDWRSFAEPVRALYDARAIIAAEICGADRMKERCARVCDEISDDYAHHAAAAIRALGTGEE